MNMKHLYTSLGSGITSGSVTDNSITDNSVIEIYFDNTDCYINSTSQSGHTVYFTVGGNATGTNVCVVVNNLTNFTPYDDTSILSRVGSLEGEVETLDNVVTTLETDVETLETRVDGLNASNINYDAHSTLYSAMGDIDELETTSKNLVGAINENFLSVSNGKSIVASAITDKGVPTESDANFQTMANNIMQIETGDTFRGYIASGSGRASGNNGTASLEMVLLKSDDFTINLSDAYKIICNTHCIADISIIACRTVSDGSVNGSVRVNNSNILTTTFYGYPVKNTITNVELRANDIITFVQTSASGRLTTCCIAIIVKEVL